ncbi:Peroxisome proliferator-activated receptor gamma coactivator-related protein 1 [Eumeta japonica]|uniref:Peroxisome proliferator-activated receptor gamma coactivator-related protein 1 n=1 Tax=Eumeta variegata TaxID=151549 RepID=A0A4C1TZ47_EUMVA|nr:Peroxisome proliferator-activated receptor gamma coactivator-related protein 1 [Eumeta japonica]
MEDFSGAKGNVKSIQRSCSLPHSPAHISYMDIDDGRTSFSFEDLNINDLPELNFEEENVEKYISKMNNDDDVPRALTDEDIKEFLIPNKPIKTEEDEIDQDVDDFNEMDMDLETPINSLINCTSMPNDAQTDINKIQSKSFPPEKQKPILKNITTNVATAIPKMLDYNVNKIDRPIKIELNTDIKVDPDDYVDVESFNETTSIPVLEANNLNSLLEQFEATEKLNNSDIKLSKKSSSVKATDSSQRNKISNGLASGTRLQDAAMQLNKNKIRQILISTATPKCTVPKKSDATVHSDHDYCSPKKRQNIITSIKKGQSLLKPEVLSSNNRILKSRHRTCKNKKVVYHISSDDETDSGVSNNKNKICVKPNAKSPLQSNHRKKLSPVYSVPSISVKCDNNDSVMPHTASKASENNSQGSTGSIKLTIKNKSKVILNLNCDPKKDSLKHINSNESVKIKDSSSKIVPKNKKNIEKNKKALSISASEFKDVYTENSVEPLVIKEEARPIKQESKDFYMTLFDNKQDLKISFDTSIPKKEINEQTMAVPEPISQQITPEIKQPTKKKLNLQEYKLRKEGGSSSNSRTVSPEAIFPDIPNVAIPKMCETVVRKSISTIIQSEPEKSNDIINLTSKATTQTLILKAEPIEYPMNVNDQQKTGLEPPKKIFDPIREASRKILMNTKKQKAEAMRKRDEDIVMSKIPKIENYKPQPLAEILNITEEIPEVTSTTPITIISPKTLEFEEIVMVSVGVNTDPDIFKTLQPLHDNSKTEIKDNKSLINFKIKKSDNVLKHNVFENVKQDRKSPQKDNKTKRQLSPSNCKELKIDKERYKNIAKTLKHVERNVEAKISSNSLFASIQDVVKKSKIDKNDKSSQLKDEATKFENNISVNNSNKEHKNIPSQSYHKMKSEVMKMRKRRESDMSLSSESSPVREINNDKPENTSVVIKPNEKYRNVQDHQVKTKERSRRESRRSSCRYDSKSNRRRSQSKNRSIKTSKTRSSRSRSRYRSRSPDRYRRYRRSDSPYRRKRSPYRPSSRRDFNRSRHNSHKSRHRTKSRSKSHSKYVHKRSKSPIPKKAKSYPNNLEAKPEIPKKVEKTNVAPPKSDTSMTPPPIRKTTVSECSESSTSSSTSSSSSSSSTSGSSTSSSSVSSSDRSSVKRRYSLSPENDRKKSNLGKSWKVNENCTRSYSSDGRDSNTSVEERRIVFVGKLEQEITKLTLKSKFSPFGQIMEVTLHSKEDGTRYGFVTFMRPRDAWTAVEAASSAFPSYDVGFGGRRAFCRQSYADLDGLEAEYSECGYTGDRESRADAREDMSFEQMLLDVKKKLSQLKQEKQKTEDARVEKNQP